MKTLVERIRNRELAIENDGSLGELRKVLKHCLPKDKLEPHGNVKYYFAEETDFDLWDANSETDLPTVSVKEVLAEIEGEGKQTKVIYLNEEDKPKIEEPLSFVEWQKEKYNYFRDNNGILALGDRCLNKSTKEYAEYLNNFKPNDKPIEFTNYYEQNSGKLSPTPYTANDFDIVVYAGNGFFWCTDKGGEGTVSVFKGNLNNGKVN